MIEGEINGVPYEIAIGDKGQTLWETIQVAQERDEVWEDWSLGLGETKQETGRGYFFSNGFDASVRGALRLAPFYHNLNNTALTTEPGYFMEGTETSGSTLTYDAASSGTGDDVSGQDAVTVAHTVASNAARLLLVGISADILTSGGIQGVKYAGGSLTRLAHTQFASGQVSFWYLLDPATGSNNIVVSLLGTATRDVVVGATSWYGVNQDAPFGTLVATNGTGTAVTATVVTAAGEQVADVVFVNGARTSSAGANQTERWDASEAISGNGSTQAGSDGGVMSSTLSSSAGWGQLAVPIKPASTTSRSVMHILDTTKIGRYTYDSDTGITLDATDTTTSGVGGRPAKVNGNWYAPMGTGASAQKLTGVTWADVAGTWKADHLSTYQKGVTPTLARVNSTTQHQVDFNEDTGAIGDNWANGQKAGDSSAKITDLVEAQDELFVCKEDNLYKFGIEAESFPVIPFMDKGKIDADNGKGSFAFGDEVVYMSKGNLWRYRIGGGVLPIGLNTIRSFREISAITTTKDGRPAFGVQAGEYWYYLQSKGQASSLIQARKRREGDPEGHELIQHSVLSIPLSKGLGVDSKNRLWIKGASLDETTRDIRVIQLAEDGSLDVPNRKGQASDDHDIYFDERNPGRPQDKVQLRHFTVELEGDWPNLAALLLRVYRDAGVSEIVGVTSTNSAGFTTRNWTVGTNDTCYRFRPHLQLSTAPTYTPKNSQPDILRVIVGIRFPEIVRIVIPAKDTPGKTALDIEQNLRRLQNQGTVTFRRPGDTTATFSAEVFSVKDTMYATEKGFAHGMELQLRRWVTP
ncbi:hypothetical protein LCGC14_1104320 [marine sediment metagenome]|uniref:Uncharacterized protein n=1 Tax=marine sediment metagenome TaxID=412755 RepID=A0A0F9MD69_9ZZZZ